MYEELIKSLREDHGKQYFARDMEAADAIKELAAFKAQITDGHFYCMKDGVLYEAEFETPKAKQIQLPRNDWSDWLKKEDE